MEDKLFEKDTALLENNEMGIEEGAKILAAGGLVAFPTETVYGLGADAFNADAVSGVYKAKGRPSDNPMIVHLHCVQQVDKVAREFPEVGKKLAEVFWPGPMTLILPSRPDVPDVVRGGLDTVGVRVPASITARKLIEESGTAIAAPSANLSGSPSPTCWEDVAEDMMGRIDAIVKGQPCEGGIESTVIDVSENQAVILRPGLITKEIIEDALGVTVTYDKALEISMKEEKEHALENGEELKPKAPGMKYKHYAPKAKVLIVEGSREDVLKEQLLLEEEGEKVVALIYEDGQEAIATRELFSKLRAADRQGASWILIRAMKREGLGFSLMNRMLKSAGYNVRRKK